MRTSVNKMLLFSAWLLALPIHLAMAQDYQVARTEYGDPDPRGVWNFSSSTPLERPESYGDTEFLGDVDNSTSAQHPPSHSWKGSQ